MYRKCPTVVRLLKKKRKSRRQILLTKNRVNNEKVQIKEEERILHLY